MAFGLEVYNSSGIKKLSVTESLTKYVGIITLPQNSNNGSQVFQELSGGRPFASVLRTSTDAGLWVVPIITFSGTTVYWTFPSISGTSGRAAMKIVVGTY